MILHTNNFSIDKWESFISKNPFSSPFQSPSFFQYYNSVPGFSAQVFAVVDSDDIIALCVVTFQKEKGVKSFFSRRAIIYGGPLIADGPKGQAALSLLLGAIQKDVKHKVIYIETRNFFDYSDLKVCFTSRRWHYEPYLDIQIPLQGKSTENIIADFKYNRRREISLSLKEAATYRPAENTEEITAIYYMLKNLYKKRVNRPLPPLEFFIRLFQSEIGKVFVVLHDNKIIGGSVCFYHPASSIFTMYYCGNRKYHTSIYPTHLSVLAAIEFGVNNNLKMLDLMGAGRPGVQYGVRRYKSGFGGEMVEYGRFIKICNPLLYAMGKAGLAIMKKIRK